MLSLKMVDRVNLTPLNVFSGKLPYEDVFKDTEDCGPKVNERITKRVKSACTKRPAKEQFSSIHKKHLRPENCDFGKFCLQIFYETKGNVEV